MCFPQNMYSQLPGCTSKTRVCMCFPGSTSAQRPLEDVKDWGAFHSQQSLINASVIAKEQWAERRCENPKNVHSTAITVSVAVAVA